MEDNIQICYDLPLKIAIFEKDGTIYVEYKIPSELTREYEIRKLDVLKKMDEFMNNIISEIIEK